MKQISTKELQLLLEARPDKHHFIDVRNQDEWALGVIENTELISLPLLPLHLSDFSADHTYIMICRSGARSGQACEWLTNHNIPNVINYSDGMLGWTAQGLPTILP